MPARSAGRLAVGNRSLYKGAGKLYVAPLMQSWTLEPIAGLPLLITIGIVLGAALWVRPHFPGVTANRRWTLAGLRGASVAFLLVMMLRPGCVTLVEQEQTAVFVVLSDISRSMELPHAGDAESRWQRLVRMLEENRERLAQLAEANVQVKFQNFDNALQNADMSDAVLPDLAGDPQGAETDIGSALDASARSFRSQRVVGVAVLSDGVQNAVEPRVELTQAAREWVESETPLFAVPFGRPADTGQFADIAVSNMPDNYTGFIKNRQQFTATVSARGFANQRVPVKLMVTDPTGRESVADAQTILFRQAEQQATLTLQFTPEIAGQYRIRVLAEPQPNEVSPRNNELPAFLTVFDGGLKVLLVSGEAGFEQRFLRQAIGASNDIQLDPYYVFPNRRDSWPQDLTKLFADDSYDVFILSNVDADALYSANQPENLKLLQQAVLRGKGLIMTGGYHSFGPGGYSQTPLADVLPVQMEALQRQEFDAPIRTDVHISEPFSVRPRGQHFLTSISGQTAESNVWESLPELPGGNRLRPRENGRVLLESNRGEPLLISATVKGRVLALAADTTYLWPMAGFDEPHKRFWRQVVLWLAFRDTLSNSNVWINLPQRRYAPRAEVVFSVGAKDATGLPVEDAEFQVDLQAADGTSNRLDVTRLSDGRHEVRMPRELLAEAGLFTIRARASRGGVELGASSAEFIVFDQDRERAIAAANPEQLARLAQQTAEFGGKVVQPDEFSLLLEQILENPPDTKIEIPQKWRLGDTWQDGTVALLMFLTLMAGEWALRKHWGMV